MPPRKKKSSKTPQKTKSPSSSSTIDPTPKPSTPTPEPEPEPEPETDIKPEIDSLGVPPEEAAEEASESHQVIPAETKTVLRVRKVVKKKIVKKLVPKSSVAAKKVDSSEVDLNPSSVLEEDFNPDALPGPEVENTVVVDEGNVVIKEECEPEDEKDGVLKKRKVVRKKIVKKLVPKGSLAAVPLQDKIFDSNSSSLDDSQQQEEKMEEDKKVEDNVEINEECGQIEVKDEILEVKDEILEVKEKILEVENEILEVKDEILESGKDGDGLEGAEAKENEALGLSERMKRRKAEIFIGGLDRDAKEEDIRSVFGKVGEILELRMMMDGQTGKNKGYAFLRYVEPSQAKRAVTEFAKVEVYYFTRTIS